VSKYIHKSHNITVLIYHLVFPAKYRRVHFLVQSIPTYSVTKVVTIIKSLMPREVFTRCPQVKEQLWGGEFWTDGYYATTVGKHGNEAMIGNYVGNQGKEYHQLHEDRQLMLL